MLKAKPEGRSVLIPSPGEWQRHRARTYLFCYPWIPAFAGMTEKKGPASARGRKEPPYRRTRYDMLTSAV
jgi:hypothetical protein